MTAPAIELRQVVKAFGRTRALDELDLLNEWTTPIGSAVFAAPPGCAQGGFIGETLLS